MPNSLQESQTGTNKYIDQGAPYASSFILHGIALALLALFIRPLNTPQDISTIVSGFDIETDLANLVPLEVFSEPSADSSALGPANEMLTSVSDDETEQSPIFEQAQPLELSPVGAVAGLLSEEVGPLASVHGGDQGEGIGTDGTGKGAGKGEFFGIDLQGKSVVFVVDASRSMNIPFPGPAKTRFGRVQVELLNTIGSMTETQRFFMIFFNHNPIPMPASTLIPATKSAREKYLNWMITGRAGGHTEPEKALLMAIQLKPEVIYFLTDGEFDYRVVRNVSDANRAQVAINCIGFGDDKGEKFLKEIAERNRGTYRYVPVLNEAGPESVEMPPQSSGLPSIGSKLTASPN